MRTAKVIYHQEEDGWWAEAPQDFPSLFAAGDTLEDTKARVWEGLTAMGEASDLGILHVVHQADAPAERVVDPLDRAPTGQGEPGGQLVLG